MRVLGMGFDMCRKASKSKGANFKSFHKCNGILGFILNLNTKLQPQFTIIQHINLWKWFFMAWASYKFARGQWMSWWRFEGNFSTLERLLRLAGHLRHEQCIYALDWLFAPPLPAHLRLLLSICALVSAFAPCLQHLCPAFSICALPSSFVHYLQYLRPELSSFANFAQKFENLVS